MTWAFMTVYIAIAILLSVGASVAVFMMAFNKRIAPDVLLFLVVATAGALSYFVGNRDLSIRTGEIDISSETWVARFANLIALGICLVSLVQIGTRGVVSRTAVIVVAAATQYYFVCFLMPVSFDRWFVFDHRLLYPLAALVIVMMPTQLSTEDLAVNFARAVTIPSALSLLLILVKHNSAVLDSYQSLLPFFPGRLYGASPHPNVLGALATFGILLATTYPPRRRWELYLLLAFNGAALLLCQSKTSWTTLVVCLSILHFPRIRQFRGNIPTPILVGAFLLLAALPAAASLLDKSIYDYWSGNQNIADIGTLTGRVDIWRATFFLISQNLVTGPGFATYEVYMHSLFPDLVANPHNLYLATLVRAGIIGIVALAIFMTILLVASAQLRGRDRLFGLAYVALITIRGLSESFTLELAFLAPTFWTLLMFMRLLGVMSARPVAEVAPSLVPARPRAT